MPLYGFRQNNSGGSFDTSFGTFVYIEADSAEEANEIAKSNGLYFNGVERGHDCDCCGDRWHETNDYEKVEDFWGIRDYVASSRRVVGTGKTNLGLMVEVDPISWSRHVLYKDVDGRSAEYYFTIINKRGVRKDWKPKIVQANSK